MLPVVGVAGVAGVVGGVGGVAGGVIDVAGHNSGLQPFCRIFAGGLSVFRKEKAPVARCFRGGGGGINA